MSDGYYFLSADVRKNWILSTFCTFLVTSPLYPFLPLFFILYKKSVTL